MGHSQGKTYGKKVKSLSLAVLAQYRDPRCKKSEEVIAASLQGNYKDEQVFALTQSLQLYDFYSQLIADCDKRIEVCYQEFEPQVDPAAEPLAESMGCPR